MSLNIGYCDARSATLRSATLRSAALRSATLRSAMLRSAMLRSAMLRSATLRSATTYTIIVFFIIRLTPNVCWDRCVSPSKLRRVLINNILRIMNADAWQTISIIFSNISLTTCNSTLIK